jgi:diguanylate cyclase (GGDEF)-like protein
MMGLKRGRTDNHERQLADARKRIAELESDLAQAVTRDQLTGTLLTLRAFRTQLALDVSRAHRYGRPLTVLVADIKNFKGINHDHGYEVGDMVLIAVAAEIDRCTRVHDLACRMGGDEFALLLPETGRQGAELLATRLHQAGKSLAAGPVESIELTTGIATLEEGQEAEALLEAAAAGLGRSAA